jgi:hypothetical protein
VRVWATVALVVIAVFAGSLAGFQWHRAHAAQSRLDSLQASTAQHAQVAAVASEVATALFTYNYRNLAATQSKIASLATGTFAQRESVSNPAVQRQLRAAKATGSAIVDEETVSGIAAGQATALVVLTTTASSNGSQSAANEVYLHVGLRKVGSDWKVDDVQTLKPAS